MEPTLTGLEGNPFLNYVVAEDKEAALYRLWAAAQRAEAGLSSFSLYPDAWQAMNASHTARTALGARIELWRRETFALDVDWEASRLIHPRLPDGASTDWSTTRMSSLLECVEQIGVETAESLHFWCNKVVDEIRVVGLQRGRLNQGLVYVPTLSSVFRWHWQRIPYRGTIAVTCSVFPSEIEVPKDLEIREAYSVVPRRPNESFILLQADIWPPDTRSQCGLMRQALIGWISRQPR